MDLMTLVGFIAGLGAVWYAVVAGEIQHVVFNKVAFILVFGGTIGSTCITYPWSVIKNLPKAFFLIIVPKKQPVFFEVIEEIINLANVATSQGINGLNSKLEHIKDEFLRSGVRMLLQNIDKETLVDNMQRDIFSTRERHQGTIKAYRTMAVYSPVFGLLGTLIGIIQILKDLTSPTAMGASMAVALTTTFYGIFGANFIFLPTAGKLEVYSSKELIAKELQMTGIVSIKDGVMPALIQKSLEKFLSQKFRTE